MLLLLAVIGTSSRWGTALLSRMDFFRVRSIEVRGTRYLLAEDVVARLRVDTMTSVWADLSPLRRRVLGHPQIADASVSRKLPSGLLVAIRENLPVALVSTRRGMQPYDSGGRELPIDPSRTPLDLPVLYAPDPRLLSSLGRIAAERPDIYQRINAVRGDGADAMILDLNSITVRARVGVSGSRLADIFPVESDLARRGAQAAELDLRFRDQVIARLP